MNNTDNNIMLDIETMGNSSNSAITAIGAVRFNSNGVTDKFQCLIDLQSSVNAGLSIDASTVLWWLKQDDSAREQFNHEGSVLQSGLINFANWCGNDAIVWGNGAAFDNAILSNAYLKTKLKQPWDYWNDRCYRTVKALNHNISSDLFIGIKHNAVNDAMNQALHLIKIWDNDNL